MHQQWQVATSKRKPKQYLVTHLHAVRREQRLQPLRQLLEHVPVAVVGADGVVPNDQLQRCGSRGGREQRSGHSARGVGCPSHRRTCSAGPASSQQGSHLSTHPPAHPRPPSSRRWSGPAAPPAPAAAPRRSAPPGRLRAGQVDGGRGLHTQLRACAHCCWACITRMRRGASKPTHKPHPGSCARGCLHIHASRAWCR